MKAPWPTSTAALVAKHLGKHIPGSPNVVVENRPGGGSMVAANTVYKTEPKDGTVISHFHEQMVLQQALGQQGVEFDARRFNWVGSMHVTQNLCIIYGYQGGVPIQNAIERREVDGMCFSWESIRATLPRWFEPEPMVTAPIIMGASVPDHPWLKGTVAAEAIAPNAEARQLLQAGQAPGEISKPHAMAPEVPADRVAAMRAAFDKTFADPAFRADVEQAKFELNPKSGEEVARVVNDVLSLPPDIVDKLKKALAPQS
jgi:hypothetical protein